MINVEVTTFPQRSLSSKTNREFPLPSDEHSVHTEEEQSNSVIEEASIMIKSAKKRYQIYRF